MTMDMGDKMITGQTSCRCCGQGSLCLCLDLALTYLMSLLPLDTRLYITSGYRCKAHNARVGGARYSRHLTGRAVDIIPSGITVQELARAAEEVEAFRDGGIGIYVGEREWVHLDVRGTRARWAFRDGVIISYEDALSE